ncbi:MAG: HAD family phosphatase [Casimicrobiaceae bacterium]
MTAFIFDIDGTIIDSMPAHEASWEVFFGRRGRAFERTGFFHGTAGRTGVELMREYFGPMSDEAARALVDEKESIYRGQFGPVFREVDGFNAFARSAHAAGYKLACATAGDAGNVAFAMERLTVGHLFAAVVGGHEVAHGKPAPDLFLLAAQRIGAAPGECIVFEDAPLGIEGARRAGMLAVALTTSASAAELAAPHVIAAMVDYRSADAVSIANLAAARRVQEGVLA